MKKLMLGMIILILLSAAAFSAIIHGTIYDMNLNKQSNVIVEVNSSPRQRLASIDGTYSFSLPQGSYTINAIYNDKSNPQRAKEDINISEDGTYVLDLFLFPDISAEEGLFNESDIMVNVPYKADYTVYYFVAGLLIIAITAFIAYRLISRKKKEEAKPDKHSEHAEHMQKREIPDKREDLDLNRIISILKKNGGRATQKEIRKEIPLSEAKISLMIAELEAEGKIKKIKKGRGNIIVLQ